MREDRSFAGDPVEFQRLLAEARGGSQDAVGQLVERYRDYLCLIANKNLDATLRVKAAPSDIVQESMLAAQRDLGDFRGESHGEWLAWLRTILINELYQTNRAYRGTGKRQLNLERPLATEGSRDLGPTGLEDGAKTPGANAIAREEASRLAAAIGRLPDDYRDVLRMRNWEQMSFAEIAQQLGRTPEATRKLWSRAVDRLRREFDNESAGAE